MFNHKALAKVFKAKFLAALGQLGLLPPSHLPEKWVVDCKCVGNGGPALVYLRRYLYRVVIQEKDILRCENGQDTYRWRESKTKKMAQRTVSAVEFLRWCCSTSCPRPFGVRAIMVFCTPTARN